MVSKIDKILRALIFRKIKFDVDMIPYEFENLPLKKIINWIMTESSVVFKPAYPWGMPTILQVEPTNRCNLRCTGCPVSMGMNRLTGDMELSRFKKIVDELRHYLLLMMFWDWGEPFLHPEAYEMIKYARSSGIRVMSSTNGHTFCKSDPARMVVESGLDVLVFSVDGITQETYQRYRNLGNLEQVLEGIRNIVAEKRRQNSKTPLLNFRFILMKHNEKEVPRLKEFARTLGVDALTFRKFAQWAEIEEKDFVIDDAKYKMPVLSSKNLSEVQAAKNPCKNLWNCPTIHCNGTVCSCFMDSNEDYPLGQFGTKTFKEIWRGSAFRKLRHDFRKQWQALSLCGICSCGFKGGDVGKESNVEVFFYQDKNG